MKYVVNCGYYWGKISRVVSAVTNNEAILQIIFRKVPIFFKKTLIFAVRVAKFNNDSKNTDDILGYSGTCSCCIAFFSIPLVRH